MSINPYDSPETLGQAPERPARGGFRLIELLVVVGIIGLLIAMLLPLRRTAGEAARRSSCSNNLRQIAIALANYEDEYDALPPAYTVDAAGRPLHSWRTLILPFLEQTALYETIDLSKPWDDPVNQRAYDAKVPAYRCPSADVSAGHTTYLAVVGPNSCLRPMAPRPLAEITDDHDLTLVVMEVSPEKAVHWMSPTDASEKLVENFAAAGKLPHPGGAQAAFVSGQVRFLSKDVKPATLRAFISMAGNDDALARSVE
jgi:type II secretory pathway pseudopilin PulG